MPYDIIKGAKDIVTIKTGDKSIAVKIEEDGYKNF